MTRAVTGTDLFSFSIALARASDEKKDGAGVCHDLCWERDSARQMLLPTRHNSHAPIVFFPHARYSLSLNQTGNL